MMTDQFGLPVSSSGDGMDSAMRAGVRGTFGNIPASPLYEIEPGQLCRHPFHFPSNNRKNFTRDQLMPLAAGLYFSGHTEICRRVFWKTILRGGFAQNSERDYPGTTKYPWPHVMTGGDPVDEGKMRLFDWADPLMPHHLMHLAFCGKVKLMYWIAVIGYPFLLLSVLLNPEDKKAEQNQLQCMCAVAGKFWIDLYKRSSRSWMTQTKHYWKEREQPEYADMIIESLSGWGRK